MIFRLFWNDDFKLDLSLNKILILFILRLELKHLAYLDFSCTHWTSNLSHRCAAQAYS